MLGQSASAAENRMFVYEVTGLRQSDRTAQNDYPIRKSGSTYIQVSYSRMNEEMQRINRQGGKIVGIHPADSNPLPKAPPEVSSDNE